MAKERHGAKPVLDALGAKQIRSFFYEHSFNPRTNSFNRVLALAAPSIAAAQSTASGAQTGASTGDNGTSTTGENSQAQLESGAMNNSIDSPPNVASNTSSQNHKTDGRMSSGARSSQSGRTADDSTRSSAPDQSAQR